MKALLNTVTRTAVLYWMAAVWALFFSVNSLGSAVMVALAGTTWSTSDGQTKFLIVVAIGVNWSNTILAYLHKGMSAISEGDTLVAGIKKIETTQTETTKTTAT